jgi:prepilin-type N-terminal cleavage/methylation domain-containing protein
MVPTLRCARSRSSRGFSLVELSVVIAIISVVATLGLELAANFVNRTATTLSKDRMKAVDEAVDGYYRMYGRLPCPAPRGFGYLHQTAGVYDYGLESCGNSINIANGGYGNGLYAGGVPFRTLNLPMSYSIDGFGNKINYIVTANLTVAGSTGTNRFGSSGGTIAQNGIAGIEVRTGVLQQPCNTARCDVIADPSISTGAAYLLFSNGADQRGAYSANGAAGTACIVNSPETRPDTQNCTMGGGTAGMSVALPYYVYYDNRYNPGLNLISYFDDAVVWRSKAQL